MPKLRIAVIGVGASPGSRARQYIETIKRLTDYYELTAVCDRNPKVLREVATQYGIKACYESVATLFDTEKIDVVLSLAPKDSHIVVALTAARHGAHIITEIPVALTRRYAAAIAEACQSTGVLWEVGEQVWLWPPERLKRQIIEAGGIGKLTHARLVVSDRTVSRFQRSPVTVGSKSNPRPRLLRRGRNRTLHRLRRRTGVNGEMGSRSH